MAKKILFMAPYPFLPPRSGGEKRMQVIFEALFAENDVILATRGDKKCVHTEEGVIYGRSGVWHSLFDRKFYGFLKRFIREQGIEVIFAGTLWSGFMAILLGRAAGIPVILDEHNVECLRFFRVKNPVFLAVYFLERWILKRADKIFFVSETDRDFAVKYVAAPAEKTAVLPNGFSRIPEDLQTIDFEREYGFAVDGKKKILFFGLMTYRPNRQGLAILEKEIIPRLFPKSDNAVMLVAGLGIPRLQKSSHLFYLSFVEDIRRLLLSVDLVIAPLKSGSGTRLKILEAIGAGLPVVSTSIGAEGIDKEVCGDKLILVPDGHWEAFSEAILKQIITPKSPVPKVFYEQYEWKSICRHLLA